METIDQIYQQLGWQHFEFEVASEEQLKHAEDYNLKLATQLSNDPAMNYGESLKRPGGMYLVDILDQASILYVAEETKKIFSRLEQSYYFWASGDKLQLISKPTEYIVFNQRNYLCQYPVADPDYKDQPYLFDFPKPSGFLSPIFRQVVRTNILNQESAVFVNQPALVLGRVEHKGEEWLYVRTNQVAGWVKNNKNLLTVGKKINEIEFDFLRPYQTLQNLKDKQRDLGIITVGGLIEENGVLVLINSLKGNAGHSYERNWENLSPEEKLNVSPEAYGDGIFETGETSILSMGNWVEVVEKNIEASGKIYHQIRLPSGLEYLVEKEYINIGFIPQNQVNMAKLVQRINGWPYSWGGSNGIFEDCSGIMQQLFSCYGLILGGRGGDAQRYGLEANTFQVAKRQNLTEDFNEFLPIKVSDLGDLASQVKWGFTTLSWGHHVMLMLGADSEGYIVYAHSVGPMKNIDREKQALNLYRMVIGRGNNTGTYRKSKQGNQFEQIEEPTNTFSPYLDLTQEKVDRSAIKMVRVG